VQAAVGATADQVERLRAFLGLRRRVMLKQYDRGPVPAGERGPDMRGGLSDRGRGGGLGHDGQVGGLRTPGLPHAEVSNALPSRGALWVAPDGSSAIRFPIGGRLPGEAGVRASIARSFPPTHDVQTDPVRLLLTYTCSILVR
jgi:hypothetical protein